MVTHKPLKKYSGDQDWCIVLGLGSVTNHKNHLNRMFFNSNPVIDRSLLMQKLENSFIKLLFPVVGYRI